MAALTVTETSLSHARKRHRTAEDTVEAYEGESPRKQSNGTVEHAVPLPACSLLIQEDKEELWNLYAPSTEAKIWGVAARALRQPSPPTLFPEYTEPGGAEYIYRDPAFWTSGFFPGSLCLLLARRKKYEHLFGLLRGDQCGLPHLLTLE